MADIHLSKAVRSNLLSLQTTATNMAQTQDKLATGLKVNSALDHPSNFFTAAALQSRAGDMSNLLDSMSSGIKTLEAADNGLKSITKTVESMQSTVRQARQDKSFKTASYVVDVPAPAVGTEQLRFAGGAVGSLPVGVDLTELSGSLATSAEVIAGAFAPVDLSVPEQLATNAVLNADPYTNTDLDLGHTLTFQLTVNGAVNNIALNSGNVVAADIANVTGSELAAAINMQLGGATIASYDGAKLVFTAPATPGGATIQVSATGGTAPATSGMTNRVGTPGLPHVAGDAINFTLKVDGATQAISLDSSITAANHTAVTAQELADEINAQFGATVASVGTGGRLVFASSTDGVSSTVDITGFGVTGGVTGSGIGNASAAGQDAVGFGYVPKSVDELVHSINGDPALNGAIRAANDAGKLRIENLSTTALDVIGIGAALQVDGSGGSDRIGGNDVRKNLVAQFNDLRDQLDKFSDDAAFNGINLLRGDRLKLTFNETGTSTIEIQARDQTGTARAINTGTLGVGRAEAADFDDDGSLDGRLDSLKSALDELRSQASSFGSNLSVVENRTDFTKNMINTLETGAANLTLADTNEEAANLLALQTRQQLSSTALSMASQADQAVLRLF